MGMLLHGLDGSPDLVLEDGVVWRGGALPAGDFHHARRVAGDADFETMVQDHSLELSGTASRWTARDAPNTGWRCCEICDPPHDPTPGLIVNEAVVPAATLRNGDVLGFGGLRWRVELRRGPVGPLADLLRLAPPAPPAAFVDLVGRFREKGDAAAGAGLLRFAHHPIRQADLSSVFLRVLPSVPERDVPWTTAVAAGLVALIRVDALDLERVRRPLKDFVRDEALPPWIRLTVVAELASDETRGTDWIPTLRTMIATALAEGEDPAAAAVAALALARVGDEESVAGISESARAAVTDAGARKRRAQAVAILGALAPRDREAVRAVLRAATDTHEAVRLAAVRALARMPAEYAPQVTRSLLGLLADPDDEVFEETFATLFGASPPRLGADALLAELDLASRNGESGRERRLQEALERLTGA